MEYSTIRNMLIQGITDEKAIHEIDSLILMCRNLALSHTETVGYIINHICIREENKVMDNLLKDYKPLK